MQRRPAIRLTSLLCLCLMISACRNGEEADGLVADEIGIPNEGGAVSVAPLEAEPTTAGPSLPETDWQDMELSSGEAWVSCSLDYAQDTAGTRLTALDRETVTNTLTRCRNAGVARLRYDGRIADDFTALIKRVTTVANELGIDKRVLEINSRGGRVEDAINAGNFIAESHWTIWVREGAVCHSSCVFILSAGDNRLIAGKVGIHRIIRMSSTADTRAELREELETVYNRVREYLLRNGTAEAVADLMMAVPNRSLRILSPEELSLYGLEGVNPVQDDLNRLHLMRTCGEDFVRRRDRFLRAFDAQCKDPDAGLDAVNACGLELRSEYGFPDPACPAESPLSEFDVQTTADDTLATPADSL